VIRFLGYACLYAFMSWQWASLFCRFFPSTRRSILGRIRYELMPVRYVLAAGMYLCDQVTSHDAFDYWRPAGLALNLWFCWYYRRRDDEDDDRWKKRRKRLASRVAEVGGRLQVVPAGAR